MYGILSISIFYIISSLLLSLGEIMIFKSFKINLKKYSSKMQSSFILFFLFSHISIILSIVYALHQPDFIKFCLSHDEFCLSWAVQEKIIKFEITDIIFISLITGFLVNRLIKAFKPNYIKSNGFISPLIYKEKLQSFLTEEEIIKLQVHDANDVYAYCQGLIKPQIHLSKGLLEFLSPEKLDIVILHEKAHIKRLDLFYTFMFKVVSIFEIYPNQINYYFKQWKKEKEKACDDEVIKKYSPLLVAQTIVEVTLKASKKESNLALNFTENQIVERIERLTDYKINHKDNNYIFLFLWLGLIGVISLLLNISYIHCSMDKIALFFLENIF